MSKSRKSATITTDREALLAAIWAAPHDDLPRLVYADWLDENGQPERAEFIRLQIDRAVREAVGDDVTAEAWRWEQELVTRHGARWLAEVKEVKVARQIVTGSFRRGFAVIHWHYTATDAVRHGPTRVGVPGLDRLGLAWSEPDGLAAALATPVVGQAVDLTLRPTRPWSATDFASLAAAKVPLAHVTRLRLEGPCGNDLVTWAAGLALARLHSLSPCRYRPGEELIAALSGCTDAARLTELDLRRVHLTDTGLQAFGRTTAFPRLRKLRLGFGTMSVQSLIAFVGSPAAAGLQSLDLVAVARLGNTRELFDSLAENSSAPRVDLPKQPRP